MFQLWTSPQGCPLRRSGDPLYGQYCLQHQEKDHFFSEKYWKWIPKLENKHYHIAKECIYHKNKQFHASEVEVLLSHTLTSNDTAFLAARLN